MRRKLLELIHACETEHQDYIDALGFDAYRARRWEHSDAPADVYEHGARAGSFASQLRAMLARLDFTPKGDN